MPYNLWYTWTYEAIPEMADWRNLAADIERKVVTIFAWMPQTIMSIRQKGGGFKHQEFTPQAIGDQLDPLAQAFTGIAREELRKFDIAKHEEFLLKVCDVLFQFLGSVAGSKYLHFSAPRLFPMWDRSLRIGARFKDSPTGYICYMKQFKTALMDKANEAKALEKHPMNPVRGWDIVCMEQRFTQS